MPKAPEDRVRSRADHPRGGESKAPLALEEALNHSQGFMKDILDNSPSLIYMLDLDGRFLLVNRRLEALVGVSREVLIGNTREAILPKEIAAQHRTNDLEVIRTRQPIFFEEENVEPDGEHYYSSQKFPLLDSDGQVYAVCGISTDITGTKRAEAETACRNRHLSAVYQIANSMTSLSLEETLAQGLTSVLEALHVEGGGILLREPDEDVLTLAAHRGLSQQFVDATRRIKMGEGIAGQAATREEPVVTDITDYPTTRLAPLVIREGFQTVAATPLLAEEEVVGALTLGAKRVRAFPPEELALLSTIGHQLGVAVRNARLHQDLQRELAERTRAEQEARKLNTKLEVAISELEAFSYAVSHDLRAPLRGVDGFSQILLEDYADRVDDQGKDYLQRLRGASQHMGALIDDLLKLSRVTRAELSLEEVSLSTLAQEVAEGLRRQDPERTVRFDIAPGLTARADPRLLRLALDNLLGNAWKFTGRRAEAHIEYGAVEQDGKPAYFVRDNGAGFDMAYANKLFGAFQRLHDTREFPGTGIGLATVQRVIQKHGGRVWAEGEVGKGATFYFTL